MTEVCTSWSSPQLHGFAWSPKRMDGLAMALFSNSSLSVEYSHLQTSTTCFRCFGVQSTILAVAMAKTVAISVSKFVSDVGALGCRLHSGCKIIGRLSALVSATQRSLLPDRCRAMSSRYASCCRCDKSGECTPEPLDPGSGLAFFLVFFDCQYSSLLLQRVPLKRKLQDPIARKYAHFLHSSFVISLPD